MCGVSAFFDVYTTSNCSWYFYFVLNWVIPFAIFQMDKQMNKLNKTQGGSDRTPISPFLWKPQHFQWRTCGLKFRWWRFNMFSTSILKTAGHHHASYWLFLAFLYVHLSQSIFRNNYLKVCLLWVTRWECVCYCFMMRNSVTSCPRGYTVFPQRVIKAHIKLVCRGIADGKPYTSDQSRSSVDDTVSLSRFLPERRAEVQLI